MRRYIILILFVFVALANFFLVPPSFNQSATANASGPVPAPGEAAGPEARARALDAYGKLPMRFEVNQGQFDARVKFAARGAGYALMLTGDEAVLTLHASEKSAPATASRKSEIQGSAGKTTLARSAASRNKTTVIRTSLVNAYPTVTARGEQELPGRSNYFFGNDPRQWRTNVAGYSRVVYRQVYRGIDLTYYGNGRQLEYDFNLAAGVDPAAIRMRIAGAANLKVDSNGDLLIETGEGLLREHRPIVYQQTDGQRTAVEARYVISNGSEVGFALGRYDSNRPLVIDPTLIYATYLGGTSDDFAAAVAVDGSGNAYVTGYTISTDFPTVNPLQAVRGGGFDAFVSKLNATGTALVYSTFFGGANDDFGKAVAVDFLGNAHITGSTFSNNFPTASPIQAAHNGTASDAFVTKLNATGSAILYSTYLGGSDADEGRGIVVDSLDNASVTGLTQSTDFPLHNARQSLSGGFTSDAFVAKLGATGSSLIYSTYLGGRGDDAGNAIATDGSGNVYVAGSTTSNNFPTVNALQTIFTGSTIFLSGNSAANWTAVNNGLPQHATVRGIAIDPVSPSTVYAATDGGLYRTVGGGGFWQLVFGPASAGVAIDPSDPTNIYIATAGGVGISTNGGGTWTLNSSITRVNTIAIDPITTSTVFAGTDHSVFKSTDSGATWADAGSTSNIGIEAVKTLVFDSSPTPVIYAGTSSVVFASVYKSTDGGSTWNGFLLPGGRFSVNALAADPSAPATVYAGCSGSGAVFKTGNGGGSFTRVPLNPAPADVLSLAVAASPLGSTVVYAGTSRGVYRSIDAGATWVLNNNGLTSTTVSALAAGTAGTVFAGTFSAPDAFVAKLSSNGSTLAFSTYLGGANSDSALGIALDGTGLGKIYVTGSTNSTDFPSINAWQPTHSGSDTDAFLTKLTLGGDSVVFSTYLGGSDEDEGTAIGVGSFGDAYVTGTTSSTNFPVSSALRTTLLGTSDAFLVKYSPSGVPIYLTYLGGGDLDSGSGIAVDVAGDAIVAGQTFSTDLPTSPGAPQSILRGVDDGFVVRVTDPPVPPTDLTVSMTAPSSVTTNSDIVYQITVVNNGPNAAQPVLISDLLPSEVVFQSCTASAGVCDGNGASRVVRVSKIVSGGSVTVTIAGTVGCDVPSGTVLANTVTVGSAAPDPNPADNQVTALSTVTNPAPGITCPANITTATAHLSDITAVVDYPSPAVTDNCPGSFATCVPPSGSTFPVGTTSVNCTAHDLAGATASCGFTVTVTRGDGIADLGITQSVAPNPVNTGGTVTVTLTIGNAGPNTALNLIISDTLPLPVQSVTASGAGVVTIVGNSVTVTVPSLETNKSIIVTVVAKVNCDLPTGVLSNTASVTSAIADPNQGNNAVPTSISVNNPPPVISCPGDLTVPAASTGQTAVTYSSPTVTDNCTGSTFVCNPASGATFPVGTTTVTCTATDMGGSKASCGFRINVVQPAVDTSVLIADVTLSGKALTVVGQNFKNGARVLVDGAKQKTANDATNPTTTLIARKAGNWIGKGKTVKVQVRNPDGVLSNEFSFYRIR